MRLTILVAGAALAVSQAASAELIVNGGFETLGPGGLNTFDGWSESSEIVTSAPTPLGTGNAARINGGIDPCGFYQNVGPTNTFTVSYDFAVIDPGAGNPDAPALQMLLRDSSSIPLAAQFHLKIVNGGSILVSNDVASQGTIGWHTVGGINAVQFSPSLLSPVVNHLTITGTFDGSSSSAYSLQLGSGPTSGSLSYFENAIPGAMDIVEFTTDLSTRPYVLDNIAATPEPASLLSGACLVGLLSIRRRQRA